MNTRRLLVANRGEIAVRIITTCRKLGVETVLASSSADRDSLAAKLADRTVIIGPPQATRSYLDHRLVVHAAVATGCDALHPGYGFLSERPDVVRACDEAGIVFVGPRAETIESLGDKLRSRELADAAGAPRIKGSEALTSAIDAQRSATDVGFPVLLKAASGGGGRGMAVCTSVEEVASAYPRLVTEAKEAFGDGTLFLEAFVETARHVEVQVIGDGAGRAWSLGLRDCSVQRRYQKMIEEAPATLLDDAACKQLAASAVDLLASVRYRGVGTVEFLWDPARQAASFMEVNTRIQVEHPVTEAVTGLDLVELQLQVASGDDVAAGLHDRSSSGVGHAIEFRINAEDAMNHFRPSPGRITAWVPPAGAWIRLDSAVEKGSLVTPYYDSMIAKLIVSGVDRADAVRRSIEALSSFRVEGVATNLPLLRAIAGDADFGANAFHTRWLESDFLPRFAA
ncbi:acetyl-CoA carboxylase biotin carboxylase subunit [Aeromicrobium wangtongii]|uniref:acetyl-CoA carboxylase biotin carboxylase subunit n=1 Tax=Aeromicrobium wangtongii TaxID=2969247 RepID=UPI002017E364|nr:biotin carboxylase N-terminal domain-containing protein [Aeromicrobium wangtongii]MCL3818594.1 ATP-grasp domain-containing protein [Aeromicrobium wangtongii]